MQMAIQLASHNTILVSSRPIRHTGGQASKIPSFAPNFLATFANRFVPGNNGQEQA